MPDFNQETRPLRVTLGDVPADGVLLTAVTGTEAVSDLFTFTLDLVAPADAPLDFAAVLGKPAVVAVDQVDGQTRLIHGLVSRLSQGRRDERYNHYKAELVPPLWLLTKTVRSRLFQQKPVKDILAEVLGSLYSPDFRLTATYHPRNICAQYRESDFAFVSRLMEEEGIYYYFTHTEGEHGLVIADSPPGHDPVPQALPLVFQDDNLAVPHEGRVTTWEKRQELRTGAASLTDHTFEMPANELQATELATDAVLAGTVLHDLNAGGMDTTAAVEHPGGYAHWRDGVDPGGADRPADLEPVFEDNVRIAKVRAAEAAAWAVRVAGGSTYCRLTAGHKFALSEHFDADGEYVLVWVEHAARCGPNHSAGDADYQYANRFECLPADLPYVPLRETPRPVVKGTQTAVVVGDDPDVDPDKYGRVKVHFRWDPDGPKGLETSCWVRVAQFWAGKQWGGQFIPRVGDEVVVAFLEGDPDQPLIIGSVYNADNMPIYALPANKTQSGIKTHSVPHGDANFYNQITFEDKKNQEQIVVHAQKDMSVTVEDNYTVSIGGEQKDPRKAGKSSSTTFGDTAYEVTKGDYKFSVSAGKADYFVKGPVKEVFDDTQTTTVTNSIDVSSKSAFVHVSSPTEILLTVGDSTVKITPDTITLTAANIHFEGKTKITAHAPLIASEADNDFTAVANEVGIEGKSKVVVSAPTLETSGKTEATHHGAKVTVTGDSKAVMVVGPSAVECTAAAVKVAAPVINLN